MAFVSHARLSGRLGGARLRAARRLAPPAARRRPLWTAPRRTPLRRAGGSGVRGSVSLRAYFFGCKGGAALAGRCARRRSRGYGRGERWWKRWEGRRVADLVCWLGVEVRCGEDDGRGRLPPSGPRGAPSLFFSCAGQGVWGAAAAAYRRGAGAGPHSRLIMLSSWKSGTMPRATSCRRTRSVARQIRSLSPHLRAIPPG